MFVAGMATLEKRHKNIINKPTKKTGLDFEIA